jgi:hypothetical protein
MNIYLRQSHIDENIMTKTALLQELRTGHALMMQCAAAAERLLGYDRPPESPAPHPRAQEEAARMAALFARLGEGYGRVALWRARLPAAALAAAVPNPGEAKLAPTAPKPKLHAAPAPPAAGSGTATPPAIT